ncbi:hypothetical protein ALC57_10815 [Trachymyrmex cornetzi]|uniref:Endonuclease/exonuclease/phosphatase domain-containing protein n=1 Tax=Trachymyrmex cornetzi TaxID=471704 RepID=A0A151J368_9HYME|nr:hypothetical protein ALC57_10815 [Trachymyrmex cornetzi]
MVDILNITGEPIFDDRIVKIETHTYNSYANTTFGHSDEIRLTLNTESSFEEIPRKSKKRGRKPKGSNVPESHALTKLSSKRMEFEDDELDREDFFQISKKAGHGMKKRKGLVECQLDDRLSSKQKDAIEEVTGLFPQMSPKSIMAETLRVLDMAGEAERRTQTMKGIFVDTNKALLPPVYRPTLGGVQKRMKERPRVRTSVDVTSRTVTSATARPSRDKNSNRTAKVAAGEVPEGRRTGAIIRTAKKIPARPAARDPRFRAHRTAAVLLRCEEAGGNSAPTYADVMRMARGKISLEELEISNTRIRKAQAGELLIEISGGEEAGAKAEAIVDHLKTVIAESEFGKKVSVIRPVQRAEVRLIDVDQSATVEEVIAAVSKSAWCFQCGRSDGHKAFGCRSAPRCPVCAARGMNANHRAGSASCVPYNGRGQTPRNEEPSAAGTEEVNEGADREAQASGSLRMDVGLVVVAKPARIPDGDKWLAFTDEPSSAAITWHWGGARTVVSCYFPPSLSYAEFVHNLDEMDDKLRDVLRKGHPTIVAGDFNARAQAWDSGRTNRRGDILLGWIGMRGLQLINNGGEPTCVHPRGTSAVDVTTATPTAAKKITGWCVATELESLWSRPSWSPYGQVLTFILTKES